ncbi:heme ABC exporter ATP-binding protein CcmA [Desulfovibrio sp. OttesenSCG-928-G15]|nr:heme ABC exporter ATP-binding protein CcmA [Desulfovibrio sp. OttesenSCG-928-G15]
MRICVNKLSHFYGSRLVFKDLSFCLPATSVTLLAGANGAGKSTLLKILAGLVHPSAGEVSYPDRNNTAAEGDQSIGYLGHQTFIYPEMTAAENLLFWARLYGKSIEPEKELARVELAMFADEKAGGFSRGMAQRLNLARVFMLQPDIVLLDEPGTGLDTRSTAILHEHIAAFRHKGAAVVWITHSLEQDLCRADAVLYLEGKKLAYQGEAAHFSLFPDTSPPVQPAPVQPEPAHSRKASGGDVC